jgi:2,3-diketo-5-methylthio-1-phosphopentane phosphatase
VGTRPLTERRPSTRWTIVVDFDGTITERDMLDAICTELAPEQTAAAEAALVAGEIVLRECIRREFESIRGDHATIVAEYVGRAVVRRGFPEFVRAAQGAGHRVVVISSGFDAVIRPVLARAGVGDLEVLAHDVRFSPEGTVVTFRPGVRCNVCGEECKRPLVSALAEPQSVVYIGDGWSDRCASLFADRRFARAGLARFLERERVDHARFESFDEVQRALL